MHDLCQRQATRTSFWVSSLHSSGPDVDAHKDHISFQNLLLPDNLPRKNARLLPIKLESGYPANPSFHESVSADYVLWRTSKNVISESTAMCTQYSWRGIGIKKSTPVFLIRKSREKGDFHGMKDVEPFAEVVWLCINHYWDRTLSWWIQPEFYFPSWILFALSTQSSSWWCCRNRDFYLFHDLTEKFRTIVVILCEMVHTIPITLTDATFNLLDCPTGKIVLYGVGS